ncbi:hypothetical protein [Methylomonas sp. AM2-LC]|uniref:hypothetical protein n=1 Tax=Methylomonas sp. AM2-LC TaxID=3153301 RepID=UPI003266AAD2
MKVKKVRRIIRQQLIGSGSNFSSITDNLSSLQEFTEEAIIAGRQTDADAILICVTDENSVLIALVAGRSVLFGEGIREYLSDYHDGVEEHTSHCINWLIDNAVDDLKQENYCFVVLRDPDADKWRGFRGDKPMTLEEIKATGAKTLH